MAAHRHLPLALAVSAAGLATTATTTAGAAPPWVDRHLTLPSGDFAFDFGLGLGHVPAPNDTTGVGVNLEMAVGLTSHVELGVRSGLRFGDDFDRGIEADNYGRLFDRQTFDAGGAVVANPEVRVTGALVRESIVELALEGRFVFPFANNTGAGLLLGVPLSFHLGDIVRLDTGAYVPIVFPPHDDNYVDMSFPLDVWVQATPQFWIGPMTGIRVNRVGNRNGSTDLSLGLGLGYQITHALDFKAMFLFPAIDHDSRYFGFGAGIEVRIE
jgi:hypothetical protein